MLLAGEGNMRWSHFSDDLPVRVRAERLKGTHLRERRQIAVLVGLQDRDHDTPFSVQPRQEFSRHALPIHNHPCDVARLHLLFITFPQRRGPHGPMLVAPLRGHKENMPPPLVPYPPRPPPPLTPQPPH